MKDVKLIPGLYKIYWEEGGHSLASVGYDYYGNCWFAPTNWITVPTIHWELVNRVKKIKTKSKKSYKYNYDDIEECEHIFKCDVFGCDKFADWAGWDNGTNFIRRIRVCNAHKHLLRGYKGE